MAANGKNSVSKTPASKPAAAKAAPAKVVPAKAAPKVVAGPKAVMASSTPVRNTPIPKTAAAVAARKEVSFDMIARRAYEISQSPACGSEFDNWVRAENELKSV